MKRIAILLAALGALLLVSASPAFAAGELEFKETFGSAEQPSYEGVGGVALDPASGDLYVINVNSEFLNVLSRYKANGEPDPFSALEGSNTIDGFEGADETPQGEILSTEYAGLSRESQVAIAPPSAGETAGYIYVTDAFNGVVDVFKPSGEYIGQESFGYPCGVAVDEAGTVFVGNYEGNAVYKMEANEAGELSELAEFPTTEPCQVAAGAGPSAGYVFVAAYEGAVTKIDSEGAEEGEAKYSFSGGARTLGVDPGSGYVYVVGTESVAAFDASGSKAELSEVTGTSLSGTFGVAVDGSSHDVYVSGGVAEFPYTVNVYSQPAEVTEQPLTARINQGSGTLVSNPAGIECSGAAITECSEEFEEGAEVTLTASPAAGYRLNTWNCASGAGTVNGRQCTVTMSEAREVRANFVPVYDLTVSKTEGSLPGLVAMNPPGDSCLYNCQTITQAYKTGAEVTLSANSYGHKHLVEFTGGTGAATACDATTECTVTIGTEDSSVEAVFGFDAKSTLSLEKAGGGTASIRAPSGFKCRSICLTASATYWQSPPEEVTVYWELEPGTTSIDWGSGAGTCTGVKTAVNGSCKVTMSADRELVATLE